MNNLVEIQGQIAKLQKQADEIRVKEFDKTVQDILDRMSAFGITLKDLQGPKGKRQPGTKTQAKGAAKARAASTKPRDKAPSTRAGSVVAAKFRGPNGETWSGRGLMPRWLAGLVAQGRGKEEFAIAPV